MKYTNKFKGLLLTLLSLLTFSCNQQSEKKEIITTAAGDFDRTVLYGQCKYR